MLGSNLTEDGGHGGGATIFGGMAFALRLRILQVGAKICEELIFETIFLQFCALFVRKILFPVNLSEGREAENSENCGDEIRKIHVVGIEIVNKVSRIDRLPSGSLPVQAPI